MKELHEIKHTLETISGVYDIAIKNRSSRYVILRCIYAKIARYKTEYSFRSIGEVIGRDHSSVIHMLSIVDEYLRTEPEYNEMFHKINSIDFKWYKMDPEKVEIYQLKNEIYRLKREVFSLNNQIESENRLTLKETHKPLLELLNKIPAYHIQTMKMRLEPIVRMLPTETVNREKLYQNG